MEIVELYTKYIFIVYQRKKRNKVLAKKKIMDQNY